MTGRETTGYAPGELVNVHINNVRYVGQTVSDDLMYRLKDTSGIDFHVPAAVAVIERVAPKEWPPQPGDKWEDRDGDPWFAIGDGAFVNMGGAHLNIADVARDWGPLTLVSRRGWTPDQPSTVDEPEPDERAAFIGGLQGLVDFLNTHPEVPHPDAAPCQYSVIGYMGLHSPALAEPARLAEALRVATLIGSELNDDLTARRSFGGGVEYVVHTYRDTPAAPDPEPADETADEPVEVTP